MKKKIITSLFMINGGIITANLIGKINTQESDAHILSFIQSMLITNSLLNVKNWLIYLVTIAAIICTYLTMLEKSKKDGK